MDQDHQTDALNEVALDGLVVLKIIKHCRDNIPEIVTGQLLGLDIATSLEVTNCYPFPKLSEEDEETESEGGAEYQLEMMRCLREVNVDNNTVGWYTSTYMSSFISEGTIDTQFNYQDKIRKSIALIYDPLKTSHGVLSLKAYRLTPHFMDAFREGAFTKDSLAKGKVTYNEIWEEIPIRIHNSGLISAFLTELEESGKVESDFEKLGLSTNPYLEKNLESLSDCLDVIGQEQQKFQLYQRNLQRQQTQRSAWLTKRRADNAQRKANGEELLPEEDPTNPIFKPLPEPSRLEALLTTNQISSYCTDINHFAGNSFAKLFLANQLNNLLQSNN